MYRDVQTPHCWARVDIVVTRTVTVQHEHYALFCYIHILLILTWYCHGVADVLLAEGIMGNRFLLVGIKLDMSSICLDTGECHQSSFLA